MPIGPNGEEGGKAAPAPYISAEHIVGRQVIGERDFQHLSQEAFHAPDGFCKQPEMQQLPRVEELTVVPVAIPYKTIITAAVCRNRACRKEMRMVSRQPVQCSALLPSTPDQRPKRF